MPDDTPIHQHAEDSQPRESPAAGYEPPQIEDLPTPEGPSVTAAGGGTQVG